MNWIVFYLNYWVMIHDDPIGYPSSPSTELLYAHKAQLLRPETEFDLLQPKKKLFVNKTYVEPIVPYKTFAEVFVML